MQEGCLWVWIPALLLTNCVLLETHSLSRVLISLSLTEVLTFKKCTMWELWVKFYLQQYEDWIQGDSTSDSSEKLFQKGRGKGQYICDFGKGGVHASKHVFCRKFLLVSRSFCQSQEIIITMKDFSAFLDMRRYKNWADKIWGPVLSVFPEDRVLLSPLHPEPLQGGVEGQPLQQHMI